jgi:hypothetical protein
MDQSSFAAPHGLSQRITSFFACACQGIHQMPLRHLIVLIANAHQYSHPSGFQTQCAADRLPFTTSPSHDAIDVFDLITSMELRRAVRLCQVFKTSFSRYDPGPRGQATAISNPSEAFPKEHQQRTTRVTGFLPTSDPSTRSDRLGHPWFHWNRARTSWVKPKTPGSLQINLLFTIFAEQAALHRSDANLFFFKGYVSARLDTK